MHNLSVELFRWSASYGNDVRWRRVTRLDVYFFPHQRDDVLSYGASSHDLGTTRKSWKRTCKFYVEISSIFMIIGCSWVEGWFRVFIIKIYDRLILDHDSIFSIRKGSCLQTEIDTSIYIGNKYLILSGQRPASSTCGWWLSHVFIVILFSIDLKDIMYIVE